jgi:hypothetical protein
MVQKTRNDERRAERTDRGFGHGGFAGSTSGDLGWTIHVPDSFQDEAVGRPDHPDGADRNPRGFETFRPVRCKRVMR